MGQILQNTKTEAELRNRRSNKEYADHKTQLNCEVKINEIG